MTWACFSDKRHKIRENGCLTESSRSGRIALRFPAPLPKGGELEFIEQVTVTMFRYNVSGVPFCFFLASLGVKCQATYQRQEACCCITDNPPPPLSPFPPPLLSSVSPAIESTPSVCLVGGVHCKGRRWLL